MEISKENTLARVTVGDDKQPSSVNQLKLNYATATDNPVA